MLSAILNTSSYTAALLWNYWLDAFHVFIETLPIKGSLPLVAQVMKLHAGNCKHWHPQLTLVAGWHKFICNVWYIPAKDVLHVVDIIHSIGSFWLVCIIPSTHINNNDSSNFPTTAIARETLMDSIHHLENTSCVIFIPRTDERDYVFFELSTRYSIIII